jgi:hypothetical protein
MEIGDFTISLGDKEDLKKSRPYIDNSTANQFRGDKYEFLLDPVMYAQQSIIIARMEKTNDLLILIFDMDFNNIVDGMRCK